MEVPMKMTRNYKGDDKAGDTTTGFLSDKVREPEYTIETPNGIARSTGEVKNGRMGAPYDATTIDSAPGGVTRGWGKGNRSGE
jgi:hypothetical protein